MEAQGRQGPVLRTAATAPRLTKSWGAAPVRSAYPAGMAPRITINGKFLTGSVTAGGVHRVALNHAAGLLRRAAGHAECRVLAPWVAEPADVAAMGVTPDLRRGPLGGGQPWEMLVLPMLSRGDLLLNFCNLAPALHRNSVVMIHDVQTLEHPGDYPARQVRGYRAFWPIIGQRSRAVLTVSEHSRQAIADHGIAPLDRIFVVHNGTDHILRTAPDPAVLDRLDLRGRPFAMTFGSTQTYKNLALLFDVFRAPEFADIPLVVTGGEPAADYPARGWDPPKGTIFTGKVSDSELRSLYEAARVFLFPSRTEGFGMPPLEAMQCGTPALVARGGAMPEVCGPGAEILDPEDRAAWSDATLRVIADDACRDALAARGAARAEQMNWDRAADRMWELVSRML